MENYLGCFSNLRDYRVAHTLYQQYVFGKLSEARKPMNNWAGWAGSLDPLTNKSGR